MYKIVPQVSSFEPSKITWSVYRKHNFFWWVYISMYWSKEDAITAVNALIDSGDVIYIKDNK